MSQTHYEEGAGRDRSATPDGYELDAAVPGGQSSPNRWKSWAGQLGLLAFGLYFFTRAFAGVDLKELADTIKSGSVPLLLLALAVGQVPRLTWAVATRAASPKPVAYRSVALLQFAIPFFNLIAPYTVARMAVNIRFFRRQGVAPAAAVSIGAIDTLGGTIAQILILIVAVVFGFDSIHLNFDHSSGQGRLLDLLLAVIVAIAIAGLIAVAAPAIRRKLKARVSPWLKEAGRTLAGVSSPGRLAQILGGNMASEVILAITLTIVARAFDASASFPTLLVVTVGAALFASLIPVPGGIGIVEGSLVVGLTAAGVDQAAAIATSVTYRLCTFYLPPIWGWFAYRALRRRGLF